MNLKLKVDLYEALDEVIQERCEDGLWDGLIHRELVRQMTDAACAVFDAAMDAQRFAKEEG